MKQIPLGGDKYALVDDEDYEFLSQFKWRYSERRYAFTTIQMHRLLCRPPKGMIVDHRDLDKLNNQKANLRPATHSQNRANQGKLPNCSSQYKGVYKRANRNCWTAMLKWKGKQHWVGTFPTEHLAALAHDLWALDIHGEFAHLNFNVVSYGPNKKTVSTMAEPSSEAA
jgi:hypothetical protein